ncbi:helix-turn-helix domain-containing protein [Methylobacterium persicinum]
MNYADEIRRQAEAAPRAALPAITAALWRAFGDGKVTEAEAEALSGLIEARTDALAVRRPAAGSRPSPETEPPTTSRDRVASPRRFVGSRPRTDTSLERRRRWAASGRLPPGLAARFTLAEQAVLALVAAETARRGDCRLAVGHLAAIAGVAETTVRNAIREAAKLGLVTVEERRVTGFRNDTNIVRIVSPEWQAWARLARKPVAHLFGSGDGRFSPAQGEGANPRSARLLKFQSCQNRGKPSRRNAAEGQRATSTDQTTPESARVVGRAQPCADGLTPDDLTNATPVSPDEVSSCSLVRIETGSARRPVPRALRLIAGCLDHRGADPGPPGERARTAAQRSMPAPRSR